MGKTLKKFTSAARTTFAILTTAAIISSPFAQKATAHNESFSANYSYFATPEKRDSKNHFKITKGIIQKKERGIRSTGNYQETKRIPKYHSKLEVTLNQESNILSLGYDWITKEDEELPAATYLYLVTPEKIDVTGLLQKVYTRNEKTGERESLEACSPEDTRGSQILGKINSALEENHILTKKDMKEKTEWERSYENLSEVMVGKAGRFMNCMQKTVNRNDRKRLAKVQREYPDSSVLRIPFFIPEGTIFKRTKTGRETTFYLDTSKLESPKNVIIIAQNITAGRNTNGLMEESSLENLAWEFKITPPYVYPKETCYGNWKRITFRDMKDLDVNITKNTIIEKYTRREKRVEKTKQIREFLHGGKNEYMIMDKKGFPTFMKILEPNLLFYHKGIVKRSGTKEMPAKLSEIQGNWGKLNWDGSTSGIDIHNNLLTEYKITGKNNLDKRMMNIDELTKIGTTYIAKSKEMIRNGKPYGPKVNYIVIKNNSLNWSYNWESLPRQEESLLK